VDEALGVATFQVDIVRALKLVRAMYPGVLDSEHGNIVHQAVHQATCGVEPTVEFKSQR
jgi:hypothetical protein